MHSFARVVLLLLVFEILPLSVHANSELATVLRHYPVAGASQVPVKTAIGISTDEPIARLQGDWGFFAVRGSLSGIHLGTVRLALDRQTIIFTPQQAFALGESVTVELQTHTERGATLKDQFTFETMTKPASHSTASAPSSNAAIDPLVLSPVTTTIDRLPTAGKVFITVAGGPQSGLYILDEHGAVLRSSSVQGMNFTIQSNGELTYFDLLGRVYYGLDSNLRVIDSFQCANDYETDTHELILFKDGSYSLLGLTNSTIDMSQYVAGGLNAATVQGNVIETFDKDHNLVFEWRGIDHYRVTDVLGQSLTASTIDFQHANSIAIDSNGSYLLSNRHLSEVTKIDGATGAIIWRLGGKNNQFTFTNDTLGFSYQHSARYLPDHHILIFDNGNLRAVPESRAVEYVLDEVNKTATLVWQFRHSPPVYSEACGNVERLPNGNTVIGWGAQPPPPGNPMAPAPVLSEVTSAGSLLSEMTLPRPGFSYRAIKIPNETTIPDTTQTNAAVLPADLATDFSIVAGKEGYVITFSSHNGGKATLTIYDMLGNRVTTVFDGMTGMESYKLHLGLEFLPSGIYFCELRTATGRSVRTFVH